MTLFTSLRTGNPLKRILTGIAVLAFWLGVWAVISLCVNSEVVLPSPLITARRIGELAVTSDFWLITASSVGRILTGFVCGVAAGVALAAACAAVPVLYSLFKPVIGIARATPVASLTLIIIIWVSNRSVPLFIVGLMVFPIIWGNTYEGIKATDKQLLAMATGFRVPKRRVLLHIFLPSVYPHFLSGAATALGLSWKAGISAEILGSTSSSVGQQINTAKIYLDSAGKLAWTVVVIVLSLVFERIIVTLLKKLTLKTHIRPTATAPDSSVSCSLHAEHLYKSYGDTPVLTDISLTVRSGETIAVTGNSGSGKTTLLKILAGQEAFDSGTVTGLPDKTAVVYQENRLLPWLTVRENLLFVNRSADTAALLRLMELDGTADMLPKALSGGMKRRVALARALGYGGSLLMLDEPFTGLDEELCDRIADTVFEYAKDRAVVLVTHNSGLVSRYADSVVHID